MEVTRNKKSCVNKSIPDLCHITCEDSGRNDGGGLCLLPGSRAQGCTPQHVHPFSSPHLHLLLLALLSISISLSPSLHHHLSATTLPSKSHYITISPSPSLRHNLAFTISPSPSHLHHLADTKTCCHHISDL